VNDDTRRKDEPVKIPLDPEEAIKAILKVDPKSPPVGEDEKDEGPAK
jgi:hypothetical protein